MSLAPCSFSLLYIIITQMTSIDSNSSQYGSQLSSTRDLKAKIIRFQSYEQQFKHYSKQINHALTYPNQYEKDIFQALLEHQQIELNKLVNVYNTLSAVNRRPYDKLIKHYQESVKEHKELIQLLGNQHDYLERIQESKQINFDLLSEYKETLTAQYLLRGVMGLFGAFFVHLIIGASSRWNMLNAYATSYYKVLDQPYLIINEDSYASPLSLFCMGLGMRAGIRLDRAVGTLFTCAIAICGASSAAFLSSYMPSIQLFVMFAFALYPFFSSLAFHAVINQCYKYYPKLKLFINGLIITGTGFGHIFFGMINDQCINPEDIQAENGFFGGEIDYICREVPSCMRSMGFFVFLLGSGAIGLMYALIKYNANKIIEKRHERTRLDFQHACASERQALSSRIFWIFLIITTMTTSGCYFLNSNFKNLRIKYETNTFKQASVLLAFNVANSSSRYISSLLRAFWAFIFTKLGFKCCIMVIASINATILGTLQLIIQHEDVYLIYYILGGIAMGGCMVVFFNFTILVFGEYVGEQMPGYVWTCYSLANLLQYIIANSYSIADYGYLPILLVLAFFNLVSLVIVLRTRLQGQWENNLNMLELKCYF